MEDVDGIILILSCEKHKNTRLAMFGPKQQEYNGWKVIKVIGNLFLDKEYILEKDYLYVKCEDSYLHLLKKLALSIKIVQSNFNIKYGILRCGDDLVFNEDNLETFLLSKTYDKYDFYGQSACGQNYISDDLTVLKNTVYDTFMLKYYKTHTEELTQPAHGIHLTIEELNQYLIRPKVWGPFGIIYYISKKACNIIVETMEQINYNIFHKDEFTNSYPYILEDCGITFIMYYNKIAFINNIDFFDSKNAIVTHTNYDK